METQVLNAQLGKQIYPHELSEENQEIIRQYHNKLLLSLVKEAEYLTLTCNFCAKNNQNSRRQYYYLRQEGRFSKQFFINLREESKKIIEKMGWSLPEEKENKLFDEVCDFADEFDKQPKLQDTGCAIVGAINKEAAKFEIYGGTSKEIVNFVNSFLSSVQYLRIFIYPLEEEGVQRPGDINIFTDFTQGIRFSKNSQDLINKYIETFKTEEIQKEQMKRDEERRKNEETAKELIRKGYDELRKCKWEDNKIQRFFLDEYVLPRYTTKSVKAAKIINFIKETGYMIDWNAILEIIPSEYKNKSYVQNDSFAVPDNSHSDYPYKITNIEETGQNQHTSYKNILKAKKRYSYIKNITKSIAHISGSMIKIFACFLIVISIAVGIVIMFYPEIIPH